MTVETRSASPTPASATNVRTGLRETEDDRRRAVGRDGPEEDRALATRQRTARRVEGSREGAESWSSSQQAVAARSEAERLVGEDRKERHRAREEGRDEVERHRPDHERRPEDEAQALPERLERLRVAALGRLDLPRGLERREDEEHGGERERVQRVDPRESGGSSERSARSSRAGTVTPAASRDEHPRAPVRGSSPRGTS